MRRYKTCARSTSMYYIVVGVEGRKAGYAGQFLSVFRYVR